MDTTFFTPSVSRQVFSVNKKINSSSFDVMCELRRSLASHSSLPVCLPPSTMSPTPPTSTPPPPPAELQLQISNLLHWRSSSADVGPEPPLLLISYATVVRLGKN
ncbi:hypothetical protein INR49_007393 [Caranx melampygus]|nr:hypothetical protein INR49_007393 [Caranx melampygus]